MTYEWKTKCPIGSVAAESLDGEYIVSFDEAEARLKDETSRANKHLGTIGDLEARLAAAEAGADGAHCVHDDCWLHGSHLGDAKRRIASLELELMRMTNDVDHRVADLETRLAAAEQRHIEPMAGCSCSACTQLRERGRS